MAEPPRMAILTGAAGGVGAAAARAFAAQGATLALCDADAAGICALGRELRAAGATALAKAVDVSDETAFARFVDIACRRFGPPDVLVAAAGVCHALTPLPDLDAAEFDRMMAVNARGVFLALKHVMPRMRQAGGGVILTVASAAGLTGAGHLAAYAASKHAVVGLTRAAADEGARYGVRVNALCPSFARTAMMDALTAGLSDDPAEAERRLTARVPLRRAATVAEVVDAILWLCSPRNSFMTGQAVALDGGLTAV
jgi:NAD(P)-dependent dehydrogenase (short-subunit alcohol dehydrogenase family)